MSRTLERYLDRHARPEHAIGARVPGRYDAAVVIPMRDEDPAAVQGIRAACAQERVLAIVVVNGRTDDPPHVHERNAACLRGLADGGEGRDLADGMRWVGGRAFDLLVVDRASEGRRLPRDQGVGLARRIGADIVASMWASQKLQQGWIHTTDADAVLPQDHLRSCEKAEGAAALVHPYWHVPSGDAGLDRAVALYEIGLRWYVVGLATAGSWWAYATLGSCISVRVEAYAAVRGMPLRRAGEDFYLLAKVAKLGPVVRPAHAAVRLASRASDRVPFGTGPGVRRLMALQAEGRPICVYHPQTFDGVAETLAGVRAFAREPAGGLRCADHRLADAWGALDLEAGLRAAMRSTTCEWQRLDRANEWLGAFRTLALVHGLRDRGLNPLPWTEAIASFSPTADLARSAERGDLDAVRMALAEREPTRAGNPRPFSSGTRRCS